MGFRRCKELRSCLVQRSYEVFITLRKGDVAIPGERESVAAVMQRVEAVPHPRECSCDATRLVRLSTVVMRTDSAMMMQMIRPWYGSEVGTRSMPTLIAISPKLIQAGSTQKVPILTGKDDRARSD